MTTFSKLYFQIVFAVKHRKKLIKESWEDELYKYISSIIISKDSKPFIINGMPDHIHIFLSTRPHVNLSDLVREIKKSSTAFINEKKLSYEKFLWQEGFGVFSYDESKFDTIYNYIKNQKNHHKTTSFQDEYRKILEEQNIVIDERYFLKDH